MNFFFHQIAQHLVVCIEIVGDNSCRSMFTVSSTECVIDIPKTYLGNQLECEYGGDRCFGVVADMDFILICTYEEDGKNPELVLYKKRYL